MAKTIQVLLLPSDNVTSCIRLKLLFHCVNESYTNFDNVEIIEEKNKWINLFMSSSQGKQM